MPKISPRYAQLLEIFMEQSHKETFGKFLTPSYKFLSLTAQKGFSFSYKVPSRLCRQFSMAVEDDLNNITPQMSTASVMAVFDQLSTYGLLALDKTRPRGGVSVLLSTEILRPVFTEQDVIVVSKCDKIGKSLGFCSMELHSLDGVLLARGKHIKYLPLGALWDIITHPVVLPLAMKFHDTMKFSSVFGRLRTLFTNIPKHHSKIFPHCEEVGSVFKALGLARSASPLPGLPAGTVQFDLLMQPHLVNNIGKMHGGAVAAVVEEACYMSRTELQNTCDAETNSGSVRSAAFVQSIEARYETAMEGDLVVTCLDDPSSTCLSSGHASVTTGTVRNRKDGQICAEYVCRWAPLLT